MCCRRARWTPYSAACRDRFDRTLGLSQAEAGTAHQGDRRVIGLIGHVGDISSLTLDSEIDSDYLMNVILLQGPQLSEVLGQARAVGGNKTAGRKGRRKNSADSTACPSREVSADRVDESLSKAFDVQPVAQAALEPTRNSAPTPSENVVVCVRTVAATR